MLGMAAFVSMIGNTRAQTRTQEERHEKKIYRGKELQRFIGMEAYERRQCLERNSFLQQAS